MFHSFRNEHSPVYYGRLVALLALALLPLAGLFAAPAASTAVPQIGVIDLDRTAKEFDGYKVAMTRMDTFAKVRDDLFKNLKLGLGLSSGDFADYKDNVSHSGKLEDKHLKDQQDLAKKNLDEYQALKAKADANKDPLSETEKTRFAQLDSDVKAVSESLNSVSQDLYKEVQDEYSRYSQVLTGMVDKSIATVAATKKLSMVVSKNVQTKDSEEKVVLWGGTDITDDVLKSLNETFKPTMLDPAPAAAATAPAGPTAPAK